MCDIARGVDMQGAEASRRSMYVGSAPIQKNPGRSKHEDWCLPPANLA